MSRDKRTAKLHGLNRSTEQIEERERIRILKLRLKIPKDFKCPECKKVITSPLSWSLGKCTSCWRSKDKDSFDWSKTSEFWTSPSAFKSWRLMRGKTQKSLAKELGWTQRQVSRAERSGIRVKEGEVPASKVELFRILSLPCSTRRLAEHMGWSLSKMRRVEKGLQLISEENFCQIVLYIRQLR
jgi:ribosomal protein L37AE/L43A|tara:strand:- start:54 stop:605 length:552 start_codon:yes stop_codon:yes gene_type:complete